MLDHVHEQMDLWAVPLGRLGYTFTAVVGAEKTIVYFGSDHSYTDGVSCLLSFWELTTIYDCERGTRRTSPRWARIPTTASRSASGRTASTSMPRECRTGSTSCCAAAVSCLASRSTSG